MSRRRPSPPRLGVILDAPEEDWPSMDLVGELLLQKLHQQHSPRLTAARLQWRAPGIPAPNRLGPRARAVTRGLTRYALYAARTALAQRRFDFFHLVDHSYAHLVNVLPPGRTGVFCHDLDAFRSVLEPTAEPRPLWFRALAGSALLGLKRAARVFYASESVRTDLLHHQIVPEHRLVHAPLGAAEEFVPRQARLALPAALAPLEDRAFVLHVGSGIPRKRLDVLFAAFAQLRAKHPGLWLVQVGAQLNPAQRSQVDALGIADAVFQPPRLSRALLAELYRRAKAVALTSDREGFGLPLLEALACGAPVVASEIAPFREIGGDAVLYAATGEPAGFARALEQALQGAVPARDQRLARAARFDWDSHAKTIAEAYLALDGEARS